MGSMTAPSDQGTRHAWAIHQPRKKFRYAKSVRRNQQARGRTADNIALRGSGTEFTYKRAADAILAYAGMLRERAWRPTTACSILRRQFPVRDRLLRYQRVRGGRPPRESAMHTHRARLYYIEDAGCKLVIAWGRISGGYAHRLPETAGIEFMALDPVPRRQVHHRRTVDREIDDIACILYTSGTTGRPKGAELTVGNLKSAGRISGMTRIHRRRRGGTPCSTSSARRR